MGKPCPDDSDGKNKHECPCRKHPSVGARLDDRLILQTSLSVKWLIELSDICSPAFCPQIDEVSPGGTNLLREKHSAMQAGRALLIAHGVNRC